MSDPSPPYRPARTLYPVPHGSTLTHDEWRRANDQWRWSRPHPFGVPEEFAWGAVMWAPTGATPWALVIAEPSIPVETAHAAARELGRAHLRASVRSLPRPVPVRAGWAATAGFVPTAIAVGSVSPDIFGWVAGAAVGAVCGAATGYRRRLSRRPWRHVVDADGAGRVFPQLRWLSDLAPDVPDQADVVWSGVREILWHAPRLGAAANPVADVAGALARTATARRAHDALVRGDAPDADRGVGTRHIDDIAQGLVGALGLEEQVYRRLLEERAEQDVDTAPIISLHKRDESA